jgi:acetyl-CoA C-acetyltransferase
VNLQGVRTAPVPSAPCSNAEPEGTKPVTDKRYAVIVGVGQVRRRPELDGPFVPTEPARMMADAIDRALLDAEAYGAGSPGDVRSAVTALACVEPISWPYNDLCATTANFAGLPVGVTGHVVPPGGNSPGDLLGKLANLIADGELDVAILAGSETLYGRRRAVKEGTPTHQLGWTPYVGERDFLKGQRPMATALETRHGLNAPINCYPLFENAWRAKLGRSVDAHQRALGEMMASNTTVAATNPHAWFPTASTGDELTAVSNSNRWICFPYTKRMNPIMEVDLSAAVVVMSAAEADRRGIAPHHQIAVLGAGSAVDAWSPVERVDFTSSPGMAAAAKKAFEHANVTVADIDHFDFYSCFPCVYEMAAEAIGINTDDPRGLTVTGGLAYAGGPGNSYAMHALAILTERLRRGDGRVALSTSLGMTATKHAYVVLSNDPTRVAAATHRANKVVLPAEMVSGPPLADGVSGAGVVETYTVEYDRTGTATRTIFVVRLDDGRRTVANGSASVEEVADITTAEAIGRRGYVTGGEVGSNPAQSGVAGAGTDPGTPNTFAFTGASTGAFTGALTGSRTVTA